MISPKPRYSPYFQNLIPKEGESQNDYFQRWAWSVAQHSTKEERRDSTWVVLQAQRLQRHPRIKDLACSPWFFDLLGLAYCENLEPVTNAEALERFGLQVLLIDFDDYVRHRGVDRWVIESPRAPFLAVLAQHLATKTSTGHASRSELSQVLQQHLLQHGFSAGDAYVRAWQTLHILGQHSLILTSHGEEDLKFFYPEFCRFLSDYDFELG